MAKSNKHICIYCQTEIGTTVDHVPPALLFPEPRPSDLVTVPACNICNSRFQKDEEFFRGLFLYMQPSPTEATNKLWPKIDRMLTRSPGLHRTISNSIQSTFLVGTDGSLVGKNLILKKNWQRVLVVVNKIIRGLYFFEFGEILPSSTRIICTENRLAHFNLSDLYEQTNDGKRSWPRIFEYKCSRVKEQNEESIWLLRFYDGHLFVVFTSAESDE